MAWPLLRCYEVKIEEVKKPAVAGIRTQDTSGLSHQCSATEPWQLATTNPHNHQYVLHKWYWMPQSHTWQPLSMCHQNSVRVWPENSLHQERTHAVCFNFSPLHFRLLTLHSGYSVLLSMPIPTDQVHKDVQKFIKYLNALNQNLQYTATSKPTYTHLCNAFPLVWGSLRLAPIIHTRSKFNHKTVSYQLKT